MVGASTVPTCSTQQSNPEAGTDTRSIVSQTCTRQPLTEARAQFADAA